MFKKIISLVLISFLLAGCATQQGLEEVIDAEDITTPTPEATVTADSSVTTDNLVATLVVEGKVNETLDGTYFEALPMVEETISVSKKDGTTTDYNVKGVLMSELLESLGVTDYTSIKVMSSDGYEQAYTIDVVNDPLTILVFYTDGELNSEKNGAIWLVAGSQSGNMFIKDFTTMIIE